jgi:hypothetical protein
VEILIQNAERTKLINKTIPSNTVETISLGTEAVAGYWSITAEYNDARGNALFIIESSELARFELVGDNLVITNIGNTRYTQEVQILIGDTLGVQNVDLGIGEDISLRLIAPDGTYSIKVSDGKKVFTKSNVYLTGEAIGFLDERLKDSSLITGVRDAGSKFFLFSKNNSFLYVFIFVVFVSAILLTIERHYRRKLKR